MKFISLFESDEDGPSIEMKETCFEKVSEEIFKFDYGSEIKFYE